MSRMGPPGGGAVVASAVQGFQSGFVVKYKTSTDVTVTSGFFETDGSTFQLAADATHVMTSLASGFDHHYIYLEKSASTIPAPVFYDETVEPVFNPVKNGWYHPSNVQDRLVGTMPSTVGAATLLNVLVHSVGNGIMLDAGQNDFPLMADLMDPSNLWQSPNINNGSIVTPANATGLRFYIFNNDAAAGISLFLTATELATLGGSILNAQFKELAYDVGGTTDFINLGASRNVYLTGQDDDENKLGLKCVGYIYKR